MPKATERTINKLYETLKKWFADCNEGKTEPPRIVPIIGEPRHILKSVRLSKNDGDLEIIFGYSSRHGEFQMSLSSSEWRGDEIISIHPRKIRFAESGEMGFIEVGDPK